MKINELFPSSSENKITERRVNKTQFEQILADPTIQMGFECEMVLNNIYPNTPKKKNIEKLSWNEIKKYFYGNDIIENEFFKLAIKKYGSTWKLEWQSNKEKITLQYAINRGFTIGRKLQKANEKILQNPNNKNYIIARDKIKEEIIKDFEEEAKDEWYYNIKTTINYDEIIKSFGSVKEFILYMDSKGANLKPEYGWANSEKTEIFTDSVTHSEFHKIAAKSLKTALNTKKVEVFQDHNQNTKEFNIWYIEPDSSINSNDVSMSGATWSECSDIPTEIVSPVFSSLNEGLQNMEKVFSWMNSNSYTNDSTGLHVTLSIKGKNQDDYDYLKMILFFDENYIASIFDRLGNEYTQQMRSKLKEIIEKDKSFSSLYSTDLNHISGLSKIAKYLLKTFTNSFLKEYFDKYFSINNRGNGSFEFRSMGGTDYQKKFPEIRKQIVRMANVLKIGSNNEIYVKEYIRKIFALLNQGKYSTDELGSGKQNLNIPKDLMFLADIIKKRPNLLKIEGNFDKITPKKLITGIASFIKLDLVKDLTRLEKIQLLRYIKANNIVISERNKKILGLDKLS